MDQADGANPRLRFIAEREDAALRLGDADRADDAPFPVNRCADVHHRAVVVLRIEVRGSRAVLAGERERDIAPAAEVLSLGASAVRVEEHDPFRIGDVHIHRQFRLGEVVDLRGKFPAAGGAPLAAQFRDVETVCLQSRCDDLSDIHHGFLGGLEILPLDPLRERAVECEQPEQQEDEEADEDARGRAHNVSRSE